MGKGGQKGQRSTVMYNVKEHENDRASGLDSQEGERQMCVARSSDP